MRDEREQPEQREYREGQPELENPHRSDEFGAAEADEIERQARQASSLEELERLRTRLMGRAAGSHFVRAHSAIDARRIELAAARQQQASAAEGRGELRSE